MAHAVVDQETRVKRFRLNGDLHELPMLPAVRLVESSRFARRIARTLLVLLAVAVVAAVFAPWQQTLSGEGRVVAYTPLERQQAVQAVVKGRVKRWGEGVREGSFVRAGDVVLELQDADPELRGRYEFQRDLLQNQIGFAEQKVRDYENTIAASRTAVESAVESARQAIREAENDLAAKKADLAAAQASELQKRLQRERQQRLFGSGDPAAGGGLTSRYKLEIAQVEHAEAVQKVASAREYVAGAEAKVRAKTADLQEKADKGRADIAKAEAELRAASGQVQTYRKELTDAESKLAQIDQFVIRAPADGYVLNLTAFQAGEYVKEGDDLFTLVPDTRDLAVEVWVSGNDAPLAEAGRHVRLQFEGWPAVQFAGWPSVAVGTFGGVVKTVDATDDGKGRFRILVQPDGEQDWPEPPYLRQGVRANGWVLLDQVPLGYEMWRRLNGFPPSVAMDQEKGGKKEKPPKPPKP